MRIQCAAIRQSGLNRAEFAIAASIVAIVAAVLAERLLYVEEYAEKTAMELTIASMRAGLRARIGELLIADQVSKIATLVEENPVDWLERRPHNYLGEVDAPPAEEPRGQWYFDRARRELVYTANNRLHFTPSAYRDFTVRVRTMPVRSHDLQTGTQPDARQTWVALVVVNDFRWF